MVVIMEKSVKPNIMHPLRIIKDELPPNLLVEGRSDPYLERKTFEGPFRVILPSMTKVHKNGTLIRDKHLAKQAVIPSVLPDEALSIKHSKMHIRSRNPFEPVQ